MKVKEKQTAEKANHAGTRTTTDLGVREDEGQQRHKTGETGETRTVTDIYLIPDNF